VIKFVKEILDVFAKHGLFEEGVTLIGSWCFQLYQKHYNVDPFPHPANFCLHKLLISRRRKNPAKAEKDLQQALLTGDKVNSRDLKKVYGALPKTWQKDIAQILDHAAQKLPLLEQIILKLRITLQNA